ncbi:hypothetical protein [Streptomyces sp. NPDC093991]|uniref:hypothetical protein n=1 Tax=unclassified Streptomyces TaxID=2593676 RepID=UPI00341997AA
MSGAQWCTPAQPEPEPEPEPEETERCRTSPIPTSPSTPCCGARQPVPAPAPGARVTAARLHDADDPAFKAFRAELRDPRWTLLLAAGGHGPGDVPVGVAFTAAAQYGEWLSVRTAGGSGPDGPAPLADPGRRLRTVLGLRPGAWILVRPDGYVAARGTLLTRPALRRALAPLVTPVPLADEARHEPNLAVRAAAPDLEEH